MQRILPLRLATCLLSVALAGCSTRGRSGPPYRAASPSITSRSPRVRSPSSRSRAPAAPAPAASFATAGTTCRPAAARSWAGSGLRFAASVKPAKRCATSGSQAKVSPSGCWPWTPSTTTTRRSAATSRPAAISSTTICRAARTRDALPWNRISAELQSGRTISPRAAACIALRRRPDTPTFRKADPAWPQQTSRDAAFCKPGRCCSRFRGWKVWPAPPSKLRPSGWP